MPLNDIKAADGLMQREEELQTQDPRDSLIQN